MSRCRRYSLFTRRYVTLRDSCPRRKLIVFAFRQVRPAKQPWPFTFAPFFLQLIALSRTGLVVSRNFRLVTGLLDSEENVFFVIMEQLWCVSSWRSWKNTEGCYGPMWKVGKSFLLFYVKWEVLRRNDRYKYVFFFKIDTNIGNYT